MYIGIINAVKSYEALATLPASIPPPSLQLSRQKCPHDAYMRPANILATCSISYCLLLRYLNSIKYQHIMLYVSFNRLICFSSLLKKKQIFSAFSYVVCADQQLVILLQLGTHACAVIDLAHCCTSHYEAAM